ncbi:MAG TPA: ABC transporter permease [Solirubrobacteraceae bacterium]|jgi:ribose transport system permease protein|nr:ABC transporter permease [Solirubrobacteraceae bacterium]
MTTEMLPTPTLQPEPPSVEAPRKQGQLPARIASKYGTIIALIALILVFSVLKGNLFLTSGNLVDIASELSIGAIISCGLTVALIADEFDLSIGYVGSFAGVLVTGFMVKSGMPMGVAIIAALAACAAIGLINGLIITKAGVHSFVATLGTGTIVVGLNFLYNSGIAFSIGLPKAFFDLNLHKILGVPLPVYIAVVVVVILWIVVNRTLFGYYAQAIGQNAEAAHLVGVRVDRIRVIAMVVSSACAGIGGILLAAKLGSGQSNAADGYLLNGFAAAFLGSVALRNAEFHIVGTVIGVVTVGVAFNGLAIVGAPTFWQYVVQGGLLIAAVALSTIGRRILGRH